MKHLTAVLGAGIVSLLLLGAGCATAEPPAKDAGTTAETTPATDAQPTTDIHAVVNEPGCAAGLDLCLTGEALGNGSVKLAWTVGDDTAKTAEMYRIVMGKDENPDWDHKSYWFERGKTYRDKTWENLPLGVKHFRVCTVVGGNCSGYSNDVSVDIK